jgi:hypothetical protein
VSLESDHCIPTGDSRLRTPDFYLPGVALGPAVVGFGNGGLVAVGDGGGGGSSSTERVGEGKGNVPGFCEFEFSFVLAFAFRFSLPMSLGEPLGPGEALTFTLEFAV